METETGLALTGADWVKFHPDMLISVGKEAFEPGTVLIDKGGAVPFCIIDNYSYCTSTCTAPYLLLPVVWQSKDCFLHIYLLLDLNKAVRQFHI